VEILVKKDVSEPGLKQLRVLRVPEVPGRNEVDRQEKDRYREKVIPPFSQGEIRQYQHGGHLYGYRKRHKQTGDPVFLPGREVERSKHQKDDEKVGVAVSKLHYVILRYREKDDDPDPKSGFHVRDH